MQTGMGACPHCGKQIMQGAMRCPGCGKILKTADEQQASIDRFKDKNEGNGIGNIIIKLIILIIIISAAYRYHTEKIEFIKGLLER